MPISREDPEFISALERGLAVIKAVSHEPGALTLTEVAKRTNLPRGTARRLLLTLEALGYVRQVDKAFSLTPSVLELGYAYLSAIPVWKAAQPIMQDVVDQINQSCAIGVLNGLDVVYIARTPPKNVAHLSVTPGARFPAHINAMGQVLLAEFSDAELDFYLSNANKTAVTKFTLVDEDEIRKTLKKVKRDGYAISDKQIHAGIRALAVPIISARGKVEFAINTTAEESRTSRSDMIERYLPVLRDAAKQLSGLV
jgi:IclR family pca regulon transcriptional regulator